MTRYQKVYWHHESSDEPVVLYSEVDDSGWETRKVEAYRDGRQDFGDASRSTGTTMLGKVVTPSVEEIDAQQEFSAAEISHDEFESIWRRAIHHS
jgi:hypothetical protein